MIKIINPNYGNGNLIIIKNNGNKVILKKSSIILNKSGKLNILLNNLKAEINLAEKTGIIISKNLKIILDNINYKILINEECLILKLEWEVSLKNNIIENGKYFTLILFQQPDFSYLINELNIDTYEL
jgi:hypothetical protein